MTNEPPVPSADLSQELRTLLGKFASEKSVRLLGLLSGQGMTADELASASGLGADELSNELFSLRHGRLVKSWEEGGREVHRLDVTPVRDLLKALKTQSVEAFAGAGAAGESRSAVGRFFDGPKLRNMPSKDKDKELVLEAILRRLPAQAEIAEKDLNAVLKEIYPDFATLRREMVDHKYLERNAGVYWLAERGKAVLGQGA
jgi:DNA-binding transcriptional ArsR family regulator